ncbi:hypothetical protein MBLNU230_g3118t1 [Neophaeotheca triangularis]
MSIQATLTYDSTSQPTLHPHNFQAPPSHSLTLTYLNEGGANILYTLNPTSPSHPLPSILENKLLRLHKALPHLPSTQTHQTLHQTHFTPLFPAQNLLLQTPIATSPTLLSQLNQTLHALPTRPSTRSADSIAQDDGYGLLVTSMTPRDPKTQKLYQLKPKWLSQSPNAPAGAKRCRTCALRARRAGRGVRTATDAQGGCVLGFVSRDEGVRRAVVGGFVDGDDGVVGFLTGEGGEGREVLEGLRGRQKGLDLEGVLGVGDGPEAIEGLCKAMTLRDCTLFVLKSGEGKEASFEARLGDLDFKSPDKIPKWRDAEQGLINEGWYTNTEKDHRPETICLLSTRPESV